MKESSLTEEKAMYAICFSTLFISLFLLVLLGFDSANTITGAVVYETPTSIEEAINYENISIENITQKTVLNAILQAERDMQEMAEEGFGIIWVNDILLEAKKYFEGENYSVLLGEIEDINDTVQRERAKALLLTAQEKIGISVDYTKVLEKTRAINDRKAMAYEINDLIRASELRINEFAQQGLDTSEIDAILSNAADEFENERYENAEDLLKSIEDELIDLSAETTLVRTVYRAGRENIAVFVKEHYKGLLLTLVLFLITAVFLYSRIMVAILRHQILDMKVEKEVLEDLMKKAQTDYYAKTSISKQSFEIKMSKYKERLAELKRKLPVVESQLEKRLKYKRIL